eukprot:CAMPEP_0119560730 /NCGR_PEP_ID=MMETSP1352-20130426/15710_1 /TAXON_ID=265584 /ORGANISM="Stauroneis constricta, Strain CCMP1120" /LENGTH=1020 /DNA_ID=CAMNT_0007608779 /DNA_START=99 /DNA_END=3161 /DNA_ORIENTATION=-
MADESDRLPVLPMRRTSAQQPRPQEEQRQRRQRRLPQQAQAQAKAKAQAKAQVQAETQAVSSNSDPAAAAPAALAHETSRRRPAAVANPDGDRSGSSNHRRQGVMVAEDGLSPPPAPHMRTAPPTDAAQVRRPGAMVAFSSNGSGDALQQQGTGASGLSAANAHQNAQQRESLKSAATEKTSSTQATPGTAVASRGSGSIGSGSKLSYGLRRQLSNDGSMGEKMKTDGSPSQRYADITKSMEMEDVSSSFLVADAKQPASDDKPQSDARANVNSGAEHRHDVNYDEDEDEKWKRMQEQDAAMKTTDKSEDKKDVPRDGSVSASDLIDLERPQQPPLQQARTATSIPGAHHHAPSRPTNAASSSSRSSDIQDHDGFGIEQQQLLQQQLNATSGMANQGDVDDFLQESGEDGLGVVPLEAELAESQDDIRDTVREEMQRAYQVMMDVAALPPADDNDVPLHLEQSLADTIMASTVVAASNDNEDRVYGHGQDSGVAVPVYDAIEDGKVVMDRDPTLPAEAASTKEPRSQGPARNKRRLLIAAVLLLVLGIVAIVLGVVLANNNNDGNAAAPSSAGANNSGITQQPTAAKVQLQEEPTSGPTVQPSNSPTENQYIDTLIDILSQKLIGPPTFLTVSELTNPSTITYQVFEWMSTDEHTTNNMLTDSNGNRLTQGEWNVDKQRLLDRFCLSYFYVAMQGAQWPQRLGFMTDVDACNWNSGGPGPGSGVYCRNDGSRTVSGIALPDSRLAGELPLVLYHMDIEYMDFGINPSLTGTISAYIGNLNGMVILKLHDTSMSGTIPSEIGRMTDLLRLELKFAGFGGSLPSEIGNCKSLTHMILSVNDFVGTIPTDFGQLTNIQDFNLYDTNVTGELPMELSNWDSIKTIDVSYTAIHGNLDPIFCTRSLNFWQEGSSFFSDCIGALDSNAEDEVRRNPRVSCSCCSLCCGGYAGCSPPQRQPLSCDNNCVACDMNFYASECSGCPKDGNVPSICERSCQIKINPLQRTVECVPRFTFDTADVTFDPSQ